MKEIPLNIGYKNVKMLLLKKRENTTAPAVLDGVCTKHRPPKRLLSKVSA
jgi:hypothetical protein